MTLRSPLATTPRSAPPLSSLSPAGRGLGEGVTELEIKIPIPLTRLARFASKSTSPRRGEVKHKSAIKKREGRLFKKPHCPVIAIEEHYWDDELEKTFTGGEAGRPGEQYTRLKDLGPLRLEEMDEAGIDIQVLSRRRRKNRRCYAA